MCVVLVFVTDCPCSPAGFETLQDCLDWLSCKKKVALAKTAQELVQRYQEKHSPVCELTDMSELPGHYATMSSNVTTEIKGKKLVVAICDFNVPGVPCIESLYTVIETFCTGSFPVMTYHSH